MLAQLVDGALDLCRADTVGLSLLEGDVFRWEAVAGVFSVYRNSAMPRAASPLLKDPKAAEVGGLGVGLALVRSLTELHGGRAEVMSDGPAQGTRFDVILPVVSP